MRRTEDRVFFPLSPTAFSTTVSPTLHNSFARRGSWLRGPRRIIHQCHQSPTLFSTKLHPKFCPNYYPNSVCGAFTSSRSTTIASTPVVALLFPQATPSIERQGVLRPPFAASRTYNKSWPWAARSRTTFTMSTNRGSVCSFKRLTFSS